MAPPHAKFQVVTKHTLSWLQGPMRFDGTSSHRFWNVIKCSVSNYIGNMGVVVTKTQRAVIMPNLSSRIIVTAVPPETTNLIIFEQPDDVWVSVVVFVPTPNKFLKWQNTYVQRC